MVIVDATKTEMTAPAVNRAKEIAAATKAKGIPDRPGVVVGLSGLQRAVAQLFGRGIHFASTIEEAKEWLVKEDEKRHWQRLFYGQRQRCGRCRLLSPGQLLSSTCHCPFGLTGL